ncbi:MAG: M28 family peptidase [Candidatus Krumholzibacteria bacterium]
MFGLLVVAVSTCGCAQSQPVEFTGESAWRHLQEQCRFGPRGPGTAAHDSTVLYIARHLQRSGARVSLQQFEIDDPYRSGRLKLTNIIGSFATDTRRRVLLAAHYDTRPWADQETVDSLKTRPILGANDAASGVGVLLEVAEILGKGPLDGLGVDLVFFDGEDYGKASELDHYLLGSKYFAANLGQYRPRAGILLDMVGAADARIGQEGNSLDHAPALTAELFGRAAALGLDVFVARRTQSIYDDHVPLLQAGIPTVDLIGLPYAHWHTLRDTPDKCSRETLRQVGTLVIDFLYNYSGD